VRLKTRDVALSGVLGAVCIVLAVTRLGFIPFFAGVSITVMHVPVIIGAIVGGPIVGTLTGLIFGVSSLILASVAPTGPGDVFFTDPWVSVAPRLVLGVIAWAVYRSARACGRWWTVVIGGILAALIAFLAYTLAGDRFGLPPAVAIGSGVLGLGVVGLFVRRAWLAHPEGLALGSAAVSATLANTVLVLGALVVRGYIPGSVALAIGVTNCPLEMIAAVIITVAVVAPWRQIALRHRGSTV